MNIVQEGGGVEMLSLFVDGLDWLGMRLMSSISCEILLSKMVATAVLYLMRSVGRTMSGRSKLVVVSPNAGDSITLITLISAPKSRASSSESSGGASGAANNFSGGGVFVVATGFFGRRMGRCLPQRGRSHFVFA